MIRTIVFAVSLAVVASSSVARAPSGAAVVDMNRYSSAIEKYIDWQTRQVFSITDDGYGNDRYGSPNTILPRPWFSSADLSGLSAIAGMSDEAFVDQVRARLTPVLERTFAQADGYVTRYMILVMDVANPTPERIVQMYLTPLRDALRRK
jgi:hypothetical protein